MARNRGALRAVDEPEIEPAEAPDYFARLETVRRVPPVDNVRYCQACFNRGEIAAVHAFEGHDDILLRLLWLRENLAAMDLIDPVMWPRLDRDEYPLADRVPHSGRCFRRGVEAILDFIELGGE
jgi:hypothetical protein